MSAIFAQNNCWNWYCQLTSQPFVYFS